MGRSAFGLKGFRWDWRFEYGVQCSNLGILLKELWTETKRYIGEDGEIVWVSGDKTDFVNAIKHPQFRECPNCGSWHCGEISKEMLRDLANTIERQCDPVLDILIFVEY